MQRTVIFTIAAKNYLAFARCLMQSVERFHPEAQRVLILVDQPENYFVADDEPYDIITSDSLDIPNSRHFHFKYNLIELCTAVKPFAAKLLFDKYNAQNIIYFDPDIVLYDRIDCVLGHSIALTPHLLEPSNVTTHPTDLDILRSGVYNLGFIALSHTPIAHQFLDWWSERLLDHCVVAPSQGIFVDQKWIDLVPSIFSDVAILRDPGLNVAFWNLHQRPITVDNGDYAVGDGPLLFFHFSGFDPQRIDEVSKHQDRYALKDLGAVESLFRDYRDRLIKNGYETSCEWPALYARFDNGVPIHNALRRGQTIAVDVRDPEIDPFSDEGYREYLNYWNSPVYGDTGPQSRVTRAGYRIYQMRQDLQQEMPLIPGADDDRFLDYLHSKDSDLHADLLQPLQPSQDITFQLLPAVCNQILRAENPYLQNPQYEDIVSWFNELESINDSGHTAPRLLRALYEDRADIRKAFPLKEDDEHLGLLHWFLTSAKAEYQLNSELLVSAETLWDQAIKSLPTSTARWRCRVSRRISGAVNSWRNLQRRSGAPAAAANTTDTKLTAMRRKSPIKRPFGLNVIGYLSTPSGVGEASRSTVRAAIQAGIPLHLEELSAQGNEDKHGRGLKYHFNLFQCNADMAPTIMAGFGRHPWDTHYNISHWAWETESFPSRWRHSFSLFDEIWTPSKFCLDAISKQALQPVLRMPYCVEAASFQPSANRNSFGLPSDQFLFLCGFDTLSVPERKNPFGVLMAFKKAFTGRDDCRLVFKINNAHREAELMHELRAMAEELPVSFLESTLTREETYNLIAISDCFVSLHRSEGFGLMLAEAMAMNKPVVCTNYSGNTDFSTPSTAFLVDYSLTNIGPGQAPYEEDAHWAAPSIDHAASQMILAKDNQEERERIAQAGRDLILSDFSPMALGSAMLNRLKYLYDNELNLF